LEESGRACRRAAAPARAARCAQGGRTLAFTDPTSSSGFKAPSALLRSEFKLTPDKDFKTAFSGKHDNSIIGVVNKDHDAAAIANSVMKRMIARKVVDGARIRTIYKSQTFPTTAFGLKEGERTGTKSACCA